MLKNTVSARQRAEEFRSDGLHTSHTSTFMCERCNCNVIYARRDTVLKHVKTGPQKKKFQTSITGSFNSAKCKRVDIECMTLRIMEAFAKVNIPLENPDIRNWLNEFVEGSGDLPCVRTLREKYIPKLSESHFNKVKDLVGENELFILCEETTDILTQQTTGVPEVVVASVSFLDKADATSCAQAVTVSTNFKYSTKTSRVS
ncbi:hypothetical protein PR048_028246 [Dryococelus australis]|uniref:C2H2-type domain-containing protein n=1 Tax=Dryococelus australis TaxID=614101 RepID=A0ABQ9GIS2_9NEOP|nr:hypothetical protein PR048_028246 [Dryococelus australis]